MKQGVSILAIVLTRVAANPAAIAVDLGTAANFVILATRGITNVPQSVIVGDIGVTLDIDDEYSSMSGLGLIADSNSMYPGWISTQVQGRLYALGDSAPTPAMLLIAVSDMEAAYAAARGQTAAAGTSLGGIGTISGMTLTAGVYNWPAVVYWAIDIYIQGSSTDVFIFQCDQITAGANTNVVLEADGTGGGVPEAYNIFWAVTGVITAEAGSAQRPTTRFEIPLNFESG